MADLQDVQLRALDPERFEEVLAPRAYTRLQGAVRRARRVLAGRCVWNVNSTAAGGGVAEMLRSLIAYARGAGVDARWTVIDGDPDFFCITKRIHNLLHGSPGDGGGLGPAERELYDRTSRANAELLAGRLGRDDIVVLHDPQTAGMVPAIRAAGHPVVWRCHVGLDRPNQLARDAWRFLAPSVAQADGIVFSRPGYEWEGLDPERTRVIAPAIDPFSPKNQEMPATSVAAILAAAGLAEGPAPAAAVFAREDGTTALVERRADLSGGEPLGAGDAVVAQVSRWDRLKDPLGVIGGFAARVAPRVPRARLVVAGPAVAAVSDDPEGAEVLAECRAAVERLPAALRRRICLATLPMDDGDENAAMVNALQRRADVVVQKSLAEGFGLTVAEAMWKSRPVVASRIGGIQDQIDGGRSGVLIDDPGDTAAAGDAVARLLEDPARCARIGAAAHRRVTAHFLAPRDLMQFLDLFEALLTPGRSPAAAAPAIRRSATLP